MSGEDRPAFDERTETDAYPSDDGNDDDDTGYQYAWTPFGGAWSWGWPSDYWWAEGEEAPDSVPAGDDDSWVDEGFFTLLIVIGLALFLFPEPGTSVIGILLMLAGAIAWLFDAVTETGR